MTKLSHLLTAIFALTAVCKLSAQDWFPEGAEWTYMYGTPTGPE